MKNFVKNFLLVLVAVGLVISFVGCGAMKENVEEHKATKDNKWEHTWVAEYENDQYIRSALQFGTGNDKIDYVDVNVKMEYPKMGKAGLIFGLNNTKEEGEDGKSVKKYNYYLIGVGQRRGTSNLEWYIDRCDGMTTLSGGNSASETTEDGTTTPVIGLTQLNNVTYTPGNPIEFDISVEFTEDEDDEEKRGTYYVTLKFDGVDPITYNITDLAAPGTIASYGMLSGMENPKNVDNTWTVNSETIEGTANLSAVEE